jgi:hypothetical protein
MACLNRGVVCLVPGDTPLHAACECGCEPAACLLVESGADMRATNGDGKIAIELATPALARTLADLALVCAVRLLCVSALCTREHVCTPAVLLP